MNGDLVFCALTGLCFVIWVYTNWVERHLARSFNYDLIELFPY